MFGGLGSLLGSFGTIPDIIMGKDPKKAFLDNLKAAAIVGTGMYVAPMMAGTGAAAGSAASPGLLAETGLNSAGYLAPEMSGMVAEQAAAPIVDMGTQAGLFDTMNAHSGGLLGQASDAFTTVNKFAKPVGQAMQMGQQMAGPEQQTPPPPQLPTQRLDVDGLLSYGQKMRQYDAQDAERRKQLMAMYANNIGRVG